MSDALIGILERRWRTAPGARPVLERLLQAWEDGHTGVVLRGNEQELLHEGMALTLEMDAGAPRPLVLHGSLLQSWQHAATERELAAGLKALVGRDVPPPSSGTLTALTRLYPDPGDPQAVAVRLGLERQLTLITGAPGTGKTHTVARLLGLLLEERPHLRFCLAAPTGKAAQRLGESVSAAAMDPAVRAALPQGAVLLGQASGRSGTLHRLLEWRPGDDTCARSRARPLAMDLVIVDEAGLLDLLLWRALLRALPRGCRLVVLGDPSQLESVEPGRVLGALVEAASPRGGLNGTLARLTRNYRFEKHPGIGTLAAAARDHDAAALLVAAPLDAADDAEVQRLDATAKGLDKALDRVWTEVMALARADGPEDALCALASLRLLCALNQGPWGLDSLNQRVEERLAAEGLGRHARPILVTVNDPHSGLFNGDLGVLLNGPDGGLAVFPDPAGMRAFSAARIPQSRTAWAVTVHRSQGSEYDTVLLVLPPEPHPLVGPELLYTAVTRAKLRVILVASEAALRACCGSGTARVSGLERWLAVPIPQNSVP